ncbi:hypothetical protein [Desulfovibrio sp. SGI.133]|uniref:hypothetical protein n=1 Tax=Desulfovibrio sp. SGI.133 TaxID=3420560 RepID=UPI003D033FA6
MIGEYGGSSWGTSGGLRGGGTEDFNKLRLLTKTLVKTDFQKDWLFRLAIDGEPSEFDLFVKDISYGVFETATDEEQYGSASIAWPTANQTMKITMTVRDHIDGRVQAFLKAWNGKVVHSDGTVGLPYGPDGYVRNVKIYNLTEAGGESLTCSYEMYPIQCGEVARSREKGEFMEFTATFVQFSTLVFASGAPAEGSGTTLSGSPGSKETE